MSYNDDNWLNDQPEKENADKETQLGKIEYPGIPNTESFVADRNVELADWILDTFGSSVACSRQIGVKISTLDRAMQNQIISPWNWGKIRNAGYRGYLRGLLG